MQFWHSLLFMDQVTPSWVLFISLKNSDKCGVMLKQILGEKFIASLL